MLCRYFEKVVKWILSNRTSVLFRERLPSCQWNPQSHILVLVPKGLFQTATSSTGCLWWISSLSSCRSRPGPAFPSSKPQWLIMLASSIATWGDLVNIYLNFRIYTSLTFSPSAFQRGVWSSIRLCTSRYSTSMRTATFPLQGSIPSRFHAMPSFYFFRISDVTTSYPVVGTTLRMNCTVQVSKDHYRWMILFHQLGTAKSMHSFSLLQLAI